MWNREQLKTKAKATFKRNYWKCILVSLLLAIVAGGAAGGSAAAIARGNHPGYSDQQQYISQHLYEIDEHGSVVPKQYDVGDLYDSDYDDRGSYIGDNEEMSVRIDDYVSKNPAAVATFFLVFFSIFFVVFAIVLGISIVLEVLICNPIEVGCNRFYVKNLEEQAGVKEAAHAFDHSYKNVVSTMFFRDLYTVLWTLLFIIPGIVKSYEYQMIPYLLAENPQMPREQAFAESKRMMDGNKWKAFVLDLSFLGWEILSVFTFGILNIFYVQPYMDATHAALYEALRYQTPMGGQAAGNVYVQGTPIE